MDARHFDLLTRSLAAAGNRRRLLGLLAGLPLLGALAAFFTDEDESAAKNRRKKRKKPHKRNKRRHKSQGRRQQRGACKAHPRARVCNGTCGKVKNNCRKTINCGSCDCNPACGTCQRCEGSSGVCVQAAPGTACGVAGQVCQDDGACACTDTSCPACMSCGGDGTCQGCTGCCDGDQCVTDCGDCRTCVTGQCAGCPGCCDGTICVETCPACTVCDGSEQCVTCASLGQRCCDGLSCITAECCTNQDCLTASQPICAPDHTCVSCASDPDGCPGATCCNAATGACVATCPGICDGSNICVPCQSHAECGTNALCVDGTCHGCDVLDGEDLSVAVGAANDGDTLYVCAGTFAGDITIDANLTLIGAGGDPDGTIVQSGLNVLNIDAGSEAQPVRLRGLRLQDGLRGILLAATRHLTMTACTLRANDESGVRNDGGTLHLTDCVVEDNGSVGTQFGGGLRNVGGPATLTGCLFQRNRADDGGGIFNGSSGAIMTLVDTLVTDNRATSGNGSGIANVGNLGSTVTLLEGSAVCANIPMTLQCINVTQTDGACTPTCPPE